MKVYLTRRYHFPASHRLSSGAFSEAENIRIFGKCSHLNGHGHNYVLEVTVAGSVDLQTGMVCNPSELDEAVQRLVLEQYDHANLNSLAEFSATVPTTENLSMAIFARLKDFSGGKVVRVRLEETAKNSFEYAGGAELAH